MDELNINDYSNYMITTNNSWSIKVEATDRRYAIFKCSSHRRGDYKYFEKLNNSLTKKLQSSTN